MSKNVCVCVVEVCFNVSCWKALKFHELKNLHPCIHENWCFAPNLDWRLGHATHARFNQAWLISSWSPRKEIQEIHGCFCHSQGLFYLCGIYFETRLWCRTGSLKQPLLQWKRDKTLWFSTWGTSIATKWWLKTSSRPSTCDFPRSWLAKTAQVLLVAC